MTDNQNEFRGFARVEVMGHQSHIGYVTTEVYGATVLFRVDQPAVPGGEETLTRPEWVGETYAPAGTVVKRGAIEPASVLVGSASIYRIIPCDEAAAMKAIRGAQRAPLMIVKLADVRQLPTPDDDDDHDDGGPEGSWQE